MPGPTQTIAVDDETAALIEKKADEIGLTPAELVAGLVRAETVAPDPVLAELERRWTDVEESGVTVPHERVRRWLETWGSPSFKPWSEDA